MRGLAAAAVLFISWGCGSTFPTQEDIENELDRQLRSVAGAWLGTGTGSAVRLTLDLTQTGTTVQGSGTFRESASAPSSQVTITGTYERPRLQIGISAFDYRGQSVTGTFSGDYESVAGILSEIQLLGGTGGSIPILLQETSQ